MTIQKLGPTHSLRYDETAAISANGRYVVYLRAEIPSYYSGFGTTGNIYRKDLLTGEVRLVSTGPTAPLIVPDSSVPTISADGRYVSFLSIATNFGESGGHFVVAVKDMLTGALINATPGMMPGTKISYAIEPAISMDGRSVKFVTSSNSFAPGDTNQLDDVYVKNLDTGLSVLASIGAKGMQSTMNAFDSAFSANGKVAAFISSALPGSRVAVKKLATGELIPSSTGPNGEPVHGFAEGPSLSEDGRYIVFASMATNLTGIAQPSGFHLYWRDLETGLTKQIPTAGEARNAHISGDGRYVVYRDGANEIKVIDITSGSIATLNTGVDGKPANGNSAGIYVANDGSGVVFNSRATNLVADGSKAGHFNFYTDMPIAFQSRGNDALNGTAGGDLLMSGAGNDRVSGGAGDDNMDGGTGTDVAVYAGNRAQYSMVGRAGSVTVSGIEGKDVLTNIERLHFADMDVLIDAHGAGGQAYRIYQAAFNRIPDAAGLGYWVAQLDQGANLSGVAAGFIASQEFQALYGPNPSNSELVNKFYLNVLHREGEAEGVAYWKGLLDSHSTTAAEVLANFSESAENQAALIGVLEAGAAYLPYL